MPILQRESTLHYINGREVYREKTTLGILGTANPTSYKLSLRIEAGISGIPGFEEHILSAPGVISLGGDWLTIDVARIYESQGRYYVEIFISHIEERAEIKFFFHVHENLPVS